MFTNIKHCRCCENPIQNLITILDLGNQPLANTYEKNVTNLTTYPLKLIWCSACSHGQLSGIVDPDELFKNYLYVSGTTNTLKTYFEKIAIQETNQIAPGNILDIACNDGSQLDEFKKLGWKTFGVDPAENLFSTSSKKGHVIICDYWNDLVAKQLPFMDLIIAQNVFAHVSNPINFLKTCLKKLKPTGKILIQTSQSEMLLRGEFDTIYHEHQSFYTSLSMHTLVNKAGAVIINTQKVPIHGTSYLFDIRLKGIPETIIIEQEKKEGRNTEEIWKSFAQKAITIKNSLIEEIKKYQNLGNPIVGYGAAAKGNTLLNWGKINLDYIVDDNPLKKGLYTPGMNIPIMLPETIIKENSDLIIIPLSWNFYEEIKRKIIKLRPNKKTTLIKYFPTIRLEII